MRVGAALIASAVAVGLGTLVVTTANCTGCHSNAACDESIFYVGSSVCIASIQTDCASSVVVPCRADGGSAGYASVFGLPDGGTCTVTALLEDGTTITVPVHWVLRSPANECCPASYTADPPSLEIGTSNIDASAD